MLPFFSEQSYRKRRDQRKKTKQTPRKHNFYLHSLPMPPCLSSKPQWSPQTYPSQPLGFCHREFDARKSWQQCYQGWEWPNPKNMAIPDRCQRLWRSRFASREHLGPSFLPKIFCALASAFWRRCCVSTGANRVGKG